MLLAISMFCLLHAHWNLASRQEWPFCFRDVDFACVSIRPFENKCFERVKMEPSVAFVSQGRLYFKRAGEELREIESAFANKVIARQQKAAETSGWKSQGVWGSGGMGMPELQQQFQQTAPGTHIAFLHVCPGPEPGEIFYVIRMDAIVGVFKYVIDEDREIRLLHRDNFFLESISRHRTEDHYAMAVAQESGCVRLSTSKDRIRPTNHVSGGMSVDQLPDWVRDGSQRVVYQSAPVGKNEDGYPIGVGNYAVELLDIENGKVETILEDSDQDFLSPKMDATGNLYFIRRPFKLKDRPSASPKDVLKDIVLFPYRLGRTAFYFANFLSTMFSGRPIADSLNIQRMPNRQRWLTLWGHALDTQKAIDKKTKKPVHAIAPADWQLVCRNANNEDTVISDRVLCFDITDDGQVVYSDGTRVFFLKQGKPLEIAKGSIVQQLSVVG